MSQFLRDEILKNMSLNETRLRKINELITDIAYKANLLHKPASQPPSAGDEERIKPKLLIPTYIIRFDNKGFRLYDFESVMKYYQEAHKIERIIFVLSSLESIQSNNILGKNIELKFDAKEFNNCQLIVQADDEDWVDATYFKLKELLDKCKNYHYLVRNRWVSLAVQISGVIGGFFVSLWLAVKLSPKLSIENSLALTFIIALLLFSNIWTIIFEGAMRTRDYLWPNIAFKDRGGIHWLAKALISTAFGSLFLYLFSKIFVYLGTMLSSIVK